MPECLSQLLNVEIADLDDSRASNIVSGSDDRSKLDHLLPAHSPQTKKLRKLKTERLFIAHLLFQEPNPELDNMIKLVMPLTTYFGVAE